MTQLNQLAIWRKLQHHHQTIGTKHMRDWFAEDPARFQRYSLSAAGIFLDYSKNRIDNDTLKLLIELADATQLRDAISALFNGKNVNTTENLPALHTSLRDQTHKAIYVDGENIKPLIHAELARMEAFVTAIHEGNWLSASGQSFTDVVNIGIGGSDLGPMMACNALTPYAEHGLRVHFVSNIDGSHISEVLKTLKPETTLFIVSSKSFGTTETLTNAKTAFRWLGDAKAINEQVIAITAKPDRACALGIDEEHILKIWPWVGGRYSVWSSIGLPLALSIGMKNFRDFLAGGHAIDQHFKTADFTDNMPVIMALLDIWYINFFGANSQAVVPYSFYLRFLPQHLKQLCMESNGKQCLLSGENVQHATGPILWGDMGCNGQHSYFQLLHQGTHFVPIDFIIALQSLNPIDEHHDLLFANCLSQSRALMQGNLDHETNPHKQVPGNKPSNTLLYEKLTPQVLGALIALYEHKVFVQSAIWGINPFDQFGVELGKTIARDLGEDIKQGRVEHEHDSSTSGLLHAFLAQHQEIA